MLALSGWAFAVWQIFPRLLQIYKGVAPSLPIANDTDICNAVVEARSVQIFVSRSDRMRTLLTTCVKTLPRALDIQVLIRDDNTPERKDIIRAEAAKWRNDIGVSQANIRLRTYRFDPLMFRGIVFDRKFAILGWYYRGAKLKQGHNLGMYKVTEPGTVEDISLAFDDMFDRGGEL